MYTIWSDRRHGKG